MNLVTTGELSPRREYDPKLPPTPKVRARRRMPHGPEGMKRNTGFRVDNRSVEVGETVVVDAALKQPRQPLVWISFRRGWSSPGRYEGRSRERVTPGFCAIGC